MMIVAFPFLFSPFCDSNLLITPCDVNFIVLFSMSRSLHVISTQSFGLLPFSIIDSPFHLCSLSFRCYVAFSFFTVFLLFPYLLFLRHALFTVFAPYIVILMLMYGFLSPCHHFLTLSLIFWLPSTLLTPFCTL